MPAESVIPSGAFYQRLVAGLARWCQRADNAWWVAEAGRRFFLWEERYRPAEMAWLLPYFAVWLIHEYRSPEGDTAARRFLEGEGRELDPAERNALEALDAGVGSFDRLDGFRLVEVVARESDGLLRLRDVLHGETFAVRDTGSAARAAAGAALLVRWIPSGEGLLLVCAAPLRPEEEAVFLEAVSSLVAELRHAEPDLTAGDVMRRRLPALLHTLLEAARQRRAGVTVDGEPVILSRAHFRLRNGSRLRAALERHPSFRSRGPQRYLWYSGRRRRPPLTGMRLVLGQVLLEGDRVVLETNARARLRRGRAVLSRAGKGAVEHLLDEYSDPGLSGAHRGLRPASVWMDRGGEPDDEVGADLREELDEAVGRHVRDHLRRWLDEPCPSLGDHTPRDAARRPTLRREVGALLSALEERLVGEAVSTSFFVELRLELGLLLEE